MTYRMKVTDYRPVDLASSEVMPVAEAAKKLGMSMPGVIRAIERGALTEVIDDSAVYHARRLVLRREVERLIQSRVEQKPEERWKMIWGSVTDLKKNPTPASVERTLEMIRSSPWQKEKIVLPELIEECLKEFHDSIRGMHLKVETNIPRDLPPIEGDRALLKRVFTELIENAIKYNRREGYVHIYLERQNKNYYISFVNTGEVIPSEEISHVFQPFYRGSRVKSTVPGQGIGLSVVKAVLGTLGGDIEVKPQQEREVTEFRVMLPAAS